MGTQSKIEWTDSPGCKHCYAETMAHRLKAMGTPGYENGWVNTLTSH